MLFFLALLINDSMLICFPLSLVCILLLRMGNGQSNEKFHCNRYLNGQGPPSLVHEGPSPHTVRLSLYLLNYLNSGPMHLWIIWGTLPAVCAVDERVKQTCIIRNGCQPEGKMTWVILHEDLPGFPGDNTLQINCTFADGIQTVSMTATALQYS